MNTKPILDVCCGGRMFYFDKYDPRVLFQDIRNFHTKLCDGRDFTVEPDIIADFTNMPYPDNSFSMVIFDPPHLRYTGSKKEAENWQMVKYGSLPSHGWQDIIRKGFSECFRVLMRGGSSSSNGTRRTSKFRRFSPLRRTSPYSVTYPASGLTHTGFAL